MKQPLLSFTCISILILSLSADAKRKHRQYDCNAIISQAVKDYQAKKYSKVKTSLDNVKTNCNGSPYMDSAYFYLGMSYLQTKMYIEARSELERVVSDFPDSPLFYEAKFRAALAVYLQAHPSDRDQKETVEAVGLFKDILEVYPSCPVADSINYYLNAATDKLAEKDYNNAQFYERMGEYEAAVVYYKSFVTQYPDSKFADQAKLTTAELLAKLDRKNEAADAITDLLQNGKNQEVVTKAKELQKRVQ